MRNLNNPNMSKIHKNIPLVADENKRKWTKTWITKSASYEFPVIVKPLMADDNIKFTWFGEKEVGGGGACVREGYGGRGACERDVGERGCYGGGGACENVGYGGGRACERRRKACERGRWACERGRRAGKRGRRACAGVETKGKWVKGT